MIRKLLLSLFICVSVLGQSISNYKVTNENATTAEMFLIGLDKPALGLDSIYFSELSLTGLKNNTLIYHLQNNKFRFIDPDTVAGKYLRFKGDSTGIEFVPGDTLVALTDSTWKKITVDSLVSTSHMYIVPGASLFLEPVSDIILDPTGNDVRPYLSYDINLGLINRKFKAIHAAELNVQTLVADSTVSTIRGNLFVIPTTQLIDSVTTGGTTIDVIHNQIASGDLLHLESDGKFEMMQATSAPTPISGGYRYSVTRNLDGTGANVWYAGDAVLNKGEPGDGWIELYSRSGTFSGTGPTIVGNVLNSTTYNDYIEHWAIGNLNGLYGYGADTYGVGLGRYASGYDNIVIDTSNGIRFRQFNTVVSQWTSAGLTLGEVGAGLQNVQVTSSGVYLRDNTTNKLVVDDNGVLVGQTGAGQSNVYINSSQVLLRNNTTNLITLDTGGNILVGQTGIGQSNVYITSGAVKLRNNTTDYVSLDASANVTIGSVGAGLNNIYITPDSLSLRTNTTSNITLASGGTGYFRGNITSTATITGGVFRTASSGVRVEISGTNNSIDFYGNPAYTVSRVWSIDEAGGASSNQLDFTDTYAGILMMSLYNDAGSNLKLTLDDAIKIWWDVDVNLYRGQANQLKTDDTFNAVALQVGGVDISTIYQPLDADLTTIAGLSSADGNFIVGSALGWVVESGATVRTSLGLAIGVNVQGYDLDLDDLADGSLTGSKVGAGINGSNITTGTVDEAYLDKTWTSTFDLSGGQFRLPNKTSGTLSGLGYLIYNTSTAKTQIETDGAGTYANLALESWVTSNFAASSHNHSGANITSGTVAETYLGGNVVHYLSGTGAPGAGVGNIGDIYEDTDFPHVYVKTNIGGWVQIY